CPGQWIKWLPGAVWDTYAYQQHQHSSVTWKLIGIGENDFVRLRANKCKQYLTTSTECQNGACSGCYALLRSSALQKAITRATGDASPHTPWIFLNFHQTRQLLARLTAKIKHLETEASNQRRKLATVNAKVNDYKRLIILLSQHRIAGVSTILSIALKNGASIHALTKRLEHAIDGTYRPRTGWSAREFDIAFLAKALGGARLLYVFQKSDGYPSNSTLKKYKHIPELKVSVGKPSETEIKANIKAFFGDSGRAAPVNHAVGQALMIDGVALEEACRYDHQSGSVLGICREHSDSAPKLVIDSIADIHQLHDALYKQKVCHHGKDGTVLAIAPITAKENYFPSPVALSPSCKAEKGEELAQWVDRFLKVWHTHPDGEKKHGPINVLATDGESSFRLLRFTLGLIEPVPRESELGQILYQLHGLNCFLGRRGLLTTCDPKHIIKRFATLIRSPTGVLIGHISLTCNDFHTVLSSLRGTKGGISLKQVESLLNPADKQNVPKAVNLVESLYELADLDSQSNSQVKENLSPSELVRIKRVRFLAVILSKFLFPFINVRMTLSEQIRSLSTYAHLITTIYCTHHTAFIGSALFADSQAIVKSIIITTARLQLTDPNLEYHILFEGSDRLEGIFSNVRTQDHSRNFDILQLAHKLSVGAEVNAIFERYPELYKGHVRRNLDGAHGIDHINPKSWIGDVKVGNVDLEAEYRAGRDEADRLLSNYLNDSERDFLLVDWDALFEHSNYDHLRPNGKYIGRDDDDSIQNDSDDDAEAEPVEPLATEAADKDISTVPEAPEAQDLSSPELEILNPTAGKCYHQSPYLIVPGKTKPQHIDTIFAQELTSDRARKSIIRTLRVRDITVDESIRRNDDLNFEDGLASNDDVIRMGDPGAFLVQLSDTVCLVVGEVLNFRQTSSKKPLSTIPIEDLEQESGPKETTVAVQILDLVPKIDRKTSNITWDWNREYIQTEDTGKSGHVGHKNFVCQIPGYLFIPLAANIVRNDHEYPVWSIEDSDLRDAVKDAWQSLHPNEDEIINNIFSLPKLADPSASLPYKLNDSPQLCITSLPIALTAEKLNGKQKVACYLCGHSGTAQIPISQMRSHVGVHILRAQRQFGEKTLPIGENPCGWCGRDSEGCQTQLTFKKRAKNPVISSNCPYHYSKMIYSKAVISSKTSPSTNVPLPCPLCPLGRNKQPRTFWKYNLMYHMMHHHIGEDLVLPSFPPELRLSAHISQKEEHWININPESTQKYRDELRLPDSD
ncbi:hypothetical protein BDN72DRAFT_730422, partial [Pluteus cervinus]